MRSRSRSAIENVDIAAATFVVGTDLQVSDFLTPGEAISNLPAEGGEIFCLEGSWEFGATISLPNKPIKITGSGIGATTFSIPSFVGPLFKVEDGLTVERWFEISGISVIGDGTAGSEFLRVADTGGYAHVLVNDCYIYKPETLVNFTAYDLTYTRAHQVMFRDGTCIPNGSSSVLAKTPNPANSYLGAVLLFFEDCVMADISSGVLVGQYWSFDLDGDLNVFDRTIAFFGVKAGSACGAFFFDGRAFYLDDGDLTAYGPNWTGLTSLTGYMLGHGSNSRIVLGDFTEVVRDTLCDRIAFKATSDGPRFHHLRFRGIGSLSNPPIEAAANEVVISGCNFIGDFTGSCIKLSNALLCKISDCDFASTITVKTVEETGTSDKNCIDNCTGLANGTGTTIIGDSTIITGELLFEGRLQRDSATQISLQRYKGRNIGINGENTGIPVAGFTLANSANRIDATGADAGASLAVDTLYYAYVSNARASFSPSSIRLSTVAPSLIRGTKYLGTSGNAANWRFVGWVRTISNAGTPNFADSPSQRLVVNYYNRLQVPLQQAVPGYVDDNAITTFDELGATGVVWRPLNGGVGVTTEFIANGEDVVVIDWDFWAEVTAGTPDFAFSVTDDGSLNPGFAAAGWGANAGIQYGHSSRRPVYAEGYHYVTFIFAMNDAAGTVKVYTDTHRFGGSQDPRLTKMNGLLMV